MARVHMQSLAHTQLYNLSCSAVPSAQMSKATLKSHSTSVEIDAISRHPKPAGGEENDM